MKALVRIVGSAVAMLLVSSSAFAQLSKQTTTSALSKGNYAAPVAVRDGDGLGLNANASFLYWYASQDAMDLGYALDGTNVEVVNQSFKYQPGFKVGIGYATKIDRWSMNADYTRFHAKSFTTVSKTNLYPSRFAPYGSFANGESTNVEGRWKMHLDMLDVVAGRSFYQGAQITVVPATGLRALLLNQDLRINFTKEESPHGNSLNSSRSWALGPKAVINTKWMFGNGFRIDSMIGTSLLYTRYTTLSNFELIQIGETTFGPSTAEYKNLGAVRSTMDLGLGLGFCSSVMDNKLLFDLSARYDFAQFYLQNMMRSFASQTTGSSGNGDLSMHGLTLHLCCNF